MQTTIRDYQPQRHWFDGLLMSAVACPLILGAGWFAASKISGGFGGSSAYHFNYLVSGGEWNSYLNYFAEHKLNGFVFWATASVGAVASVYFIKYALRKIDPIKHHAGLRLRVGEDAKRYAKELSKKFLSGKKEADYGIWINDDLQLSRAQERSSILVMGAVGGGKTVFINHITKQLFARGDKLIIMDVTKGDYTRTTPNALILSVADSRTATWWLGADLCDTAAASNFAAAMIPKSDKDPIWANASQGILIAIILKLNNNLVNKWSWQELSNELNSDIESLHKACADFYPPAAAGIQDAESKTTTSILINLQTFCAPIFRLARQWTKVDPKKRLSLKKWLDDDNVKIRNIIIQGDQRDGELSSALSRALVSYAISHIASLQFAESKTRRLWFILDELPRAGKLDNITVINVVGRSKGVAIIAGFQDIAQIREIYSQNEAQTFAAIAGIKIYPKVSGAESQKWVADQLGQRQVTISNKSVSKNGNGNSLSHSQNFQTLPVILPTQLDTEFGASASGIDALVVGLGDPMRLHWNFEDEVKVREHFVPWPNQPKSTAPILLNNNATLLNNNQNEITDAQEPNQKSTIEVDSVAMFDELMPAQNTEEAPAIIQPTEAEADPISEVTDDIVNEALTHSIAPALGILMQIDTVSNIFNDDIPPAQHQKSQRKRILKNEQSTNG